MAIIISDYYNSKNGKGRSEFCYWGWGVGRGGCVGKVLQLLLLFWKNLQFLQIIGGSEHPLDATPL